jgi:hypothetical protein
MPNRSSEVGCRDRYKQDWYEHRERVRGNDYQDAKREKGTTGGRTDNWKDERRENCRGGGKGDKYNESA